MKISILNKIKEKYSDWLAYGVVFDDPTTFDDEDMDLSLDLETNNIKVYLDYEFGTIYITGLTEEEQNYLKEVK